MPDATQEEFLSALRKELASLKLEVLHPWEQVSTPASVVREVYPDGRPKSAPWIMDDVEIAKVPLDKIFNRPLAEARARLDAARLEFEKLRRIWFANPTPDCGRVLKLVQGRYKRARAEARKLGILPKKGS